MTDEALAAIRARAEAATPGPWTPTTADSISGGAIYGQGWNIAEATIYNGPPSGWTADLPGARRTYIDTDANAAFIAHAREDVPALLAEVERLQGENAALREHMREVVDAYYLARAPSEVASAYDPDRIRAGVALGQAVEAARALLGKE